MNETRLSTHEQVDRLKPYLLAVLALLAAGCDGGGGGGNDSAAVANASSETVSVSGRVTFEYVPIFRGMGSGLDYNATEPRAARGVTVQLIEGSHTVDTVVTDEDGGYTVDAPRGAKIFLRVRAELRGEGAAPLVRVMDNTRHDALYTMEGTPFSPGETDLVRDLHGASGWTGSGYESERVAAPFAILDVVYEAMEWVRSVDADVAFLPLDVFWSPSNVGVLGDNGEPDYSTGRIGGTHYRRSDSEGSRPAAIHLLGAENEDTDEFDRGVIAHEWVHYFLDTLSRDDSIGGRHSLGQQLDLRVAFSEGVANAVAAMIVGDTFLLDSLGPQQAFGGWVSVEVMAPSRPGWFSEASVMAIVYDLMDPINDDALEFGFEGLYDVFLNELRETPALTSVFPFIHALKTRRPERAVAIDALLGAHWIEPIMDPFGSAETNSGYPPDPDTLPIYARATVNAGAVNVCSTAHFRGGEARGNGLGIWRFVRFVAERGGRHSVLAEADSAPPGKRADPSLGFFAKGFVGGAQRPPGVSCTPDSLRQCSEQLTVELPAGGGEYVIEVAEATNRGLDEDEEANGRTCFDVGVTSP